ncbi:hypothetical protein SCLCIDRAFT_1222689 [Scleroderma citrinum Foug A]|uniref:Uncharacterized protein n=1 Tax=Scleroderma citrinum Foug A TaxID=1036808 RepID=A0A0C2ZLE3_9AGAM|nr:hypothetical protein SCLCIDRAFT_1222689 [Scleroderma citrinum Foug A]
MYYDPFTEFDRLFEDAFVTRLFPSCAVVEKGPEHKYRTSRAFPPQLCMTPVVGDT